MKDDEDLRGSSAGSRPIDLASLAVVTAIFGAAAVVWQAGPPGRIPMHFNVTGQPDRWGDRGQMALLIAQIGLVAAGLALAAVFFERQGRDPAAERFTYRLGRIIGLAATGLAALLLTLVAFDRLPSAGGQGPFLRVTMGGLALLFLGMGAFLGRVKPNPLVGVRTYWSLRSRLAWDKSNRLAGRLFSIVGVLGLIAAPLIPVAYGLGALVVGVVLASLASAFESWRVWRADPDRA